MVVSACPQIKVLYACVPLVLLEISARSEWICRLVLFEESPLLVVLMKYFVLGSRL